MNNLFKQYQPQLLKLANNPLGRYYLGISHEVKDKIVKLDPNAYTTQVGRRKFQSTFRCYNLFEKKLGGALKFSDSLLEGIKYYFTPQEFRWLEYCASPETLYAGAGDGTCTNLMLTASYSWAQTIAAASSSGVDYTSESMYSLASSAAWGGNSWGCLRTFYPFDLSTIAGTATAVTFSDYMIAKGIADATGKYGNIFEGLQASTSVLATSDYSKFGTTAWAAQVDYNAASINTYQDFVFNATGIAATTLGGWVKYCKRMYRDWTATTPSAENYITTRFSEYAGTTNDPKLVVTYTLPSSGFLAFM